jgi:hypothetical protein
MDSPRYENRSDSESLASRRCRVNHRVKRVLGISVLGIETILKIYAFSSLDRFQKALLAVESRAFGR